MHVQLEDFVLDTTQNCLLLLVGKTVSVNGTRHNQGAQVRLQFGDLLCFGDDKVRQFAYFQIDN